MMNILNMGLPEIILVGVIMLIFLGPQGMKESALKFGKLIRRVIRSDAWKTFNALYDEVKELPKQLVQEAELEELKESLKAPTETSFPTAPQEGPIKQEENVHE